MKHISGVLVVESPEELRAWCAEQRRVGLSLGLVPTMGALHEGHLRLVDLCRSHVDRVIVSVFVNPTQFAPGEDFERYPRQLQADCAMCASRQVAVVYAPTPSAMYPEGFQTHVEVEQVPQRWCGASRPGHFRGVATVVTKLLNAAMADVAVFGEKDWQQLQVIRQLCRDLDHPTEILGAPIVRENDGLAMSSRNVYLSPTERSGALSISRGIDQLIARARSADAQPRDLEAQLASSVTAAGGVVEYAAIVDPQTLEPLTDLRHAGRVLVAARFGRTRLIDNAPL